MSAYGIVIVSHVQAIAKGITQLIDQVAKDVCVTYAGGLSENEVGTSFELILQAVEENTADHLLAFFDLGSARMHLDMISDFTDKVIQLQTVPIVEGAYTAAALLQVDTPIEAVLEQLEALKITK